MSSKCAIKLSFNGLFTVHFRRATILSVISRFSAALFSSISLRYAFCHFHGYFRAPTARQMMKKVFCIYISRSYRQTTLDMQGESNSTAIISFAFPNINIFFATQAYKTKVHKYQIYSILLSLRWMPI